MVVPTNYFLFSEIVNQLKEKMCTHLLSEKVCDIIYRSPDAAQENKTPLDIPRHHFSLNPTKTEQEKCIVQNYCIYMTPEFHYNLEKTIVIKPRHSIDAVICNEHLQDESCAIPTKEGGIVVLRLFNSSFKKKIIIPPKISLRKIMDHPLMCKFLV